MVSKTRTLLMGGLVLAVAVVSLFFAMQEKVGSPPPGSSPPVSDSQLPGATPPSGSGTSEDGLTANPSPHPVGSGHPPTVRPPATSIESVDQIAHELDLGNIVFNAPKSMRYAQSQVVELLLSPSLSITDLQEQLKQKAGADSARIRISNRMEAKLSGETFDIIPQAPDLQAVTSEHATRWSWQVTPTEHGERTLHLEVFAHIDVAGHDTPLVLRTFDRDIRVDITATQRASGFLHHNWQWLWAAVIVPVVGYLWQRRKKKNAQRA